MEKKNEKLLSVLVDVLLGLVFALYLLAKKEGVAAHLKKTHYDSPSAKESKHPLSCAA